LKNALKERLYQGETCFGTWINSSSPTVVDFLRNLEFDWFLVDTEHAPVNPETLNHMVQLIGDSKVTPIVRVGANDIYLIKSALDSGARGVVVPLINSKKEAEQAVSFSRYPPEGLRGVGPVRAHRYGLDFKDYIRTSNKEVLVIGQIETLPALEHLDEILSVEGLDVAFFGPSDMTMALGLFEDRTNPQVISAMKRVIEGCNNHGKIPGTLAVTLGEAKNAIDIGFKFIGLSSDMRFVADGANQYLRSVGRKQ
jgi:2-keto-3-deoxy-L-rhamnonate aldolase RhmA